MILTVPWLLSTNETTSSRPVAECPRSLVEGHSVLQEVVRGLRCMPFEAQGYLRCGLTPLRRATRPAGPGLLVGLAQATRQGPALCA